MGQTMLITWHNHEGYIKVASGIRSSQKDYIQHCTVARSRSRLTSKLRKTLPTASNETQVQGRPRRDALPLKQVRAPRGYRVLVGLNGLYMIRARYNMGVVKGLSVLSQNWQPKITKVRLSHFFNSVLSNNQMIV